MEEMELEVIDHHLQGIMDCSDMVNLFCLLGMAKPYRQQCHRLSHLMTSFRRVNRMYVDKYQEIPVVATNFQRMYDAPSVTPASIELVGTVIDSWIAWETKGIELYQKLLDELPESYRERWVWQKMLATAKDCLKAANYCKQQYAPQSNTTQATKLATNGTTSIRQRMQEKLAATQK